MNDFKERLSLTAIASRRGKEDGRNAAEWWVQDRLANAYPAAAVRVAASLILKGIDDGDPVIMESLPMPDLSGQWAGVMTADQLYQEVMTEAGRGTEDDDPDFYADLEEVLNEYETAYQSVVEEEIVKACKAHMGIDERS